MEPTTTAYNPNFFQERRDKDQEIFNQWKNSGSKEHLSALLNQMSPVIYKEVQRQSGTLPRAALEAQAKTWAVKAFQTYDPKKGAVLSTHLTNYLQKVRRLNYQYQNSARLPENLQLRYNDYNQAVTTLSEELNRQPNDKEVAARMGWSESKTMKFRNRLHEDLVESTNERPVEASRYSDSGLLMEHLMSQLTEEERYLLLNNKTVSAKEMAEHLGVNISRLNYLKSKLVTKISGIKQEIGL